jgi:hypothetical protein
VSTDNHRGPRSRPADIAATLVLLIVHGALFGATIVLLGLLVMGTDPVRFREMRRPGLD